MVGFLTIMLVSISPVYALMMKNNTTHALTVDCKDLQNKEIFCGFPDAPTLSPQQLATLSFPKGEFIRYIDLSVNVLSDDNSGYLEKFHGTVMNTSAFQMELISH